NAAASPKSRRLAFVFSQLVVRVTCRIRCLLTIMKISEFPSALNGGICPLRRCLRPSISSPFDSSTIRPPPSLTAGRALSPPDNVYCHSSFLKSRNMKISKPVPPLAIGSMLDWYTTNGPRAKLLALDIAGFKLLPAPGMESCSFAPFVRGWLYTWLPVDPLASWSAVDWYAVDWHC